MLTVLLNDGSPNTVRNANRWKSFGVIEASAVIFSYLLEEPFDVLWDFISQMGTAEEIKGLDKLKENLKRYFKYTEGCDKRLADYILDPLLAAGENDH